MTDSATACARGRDRPRWARTQVKPMLVAWANPRTQRGRRRSRRGGRSAEGRSPHRRYGASSVRAWSWNRSSPPKVRTHLRGELAPAREPGPQQEGGRAGARASVAGDAGVGAAAFALAPPAEHCGCARAAGARALTGGVRLRGGAVPLPRRGEAGRDQRRRAGPTPPARRARPRKRHGRCCSSGSGPRADVVSPLAKAVESRISLL